MAGRTRKQKQPSTTESSQEIVPELSEPTPSSVSGNDSIDRLADIMANFIQTQNTVQNRNTSAAKLDTGKSDVVPAFNPEDREQSSTLWLNKVDELRQIFHWSEEATIYFALSKLTGLAETWYKGLQTMSFTWEEWKEKILVAFPSVRDHYEMLTDMIRRRKRQDESYSRYYYEKLTLINQCKITGVDAVSCILGGIDDVVVKASAKAGNYQTPEGLYQYLSSLNDLRPSLSRPTASKHSFNKNNSIGKWNKGENRKQGSSKCFKCGRSGHRQRDCDAKRCTFCRRVGHLEDECYTKKRQHSNNVKTVS